MNLKRIFWLLAFLLGMVGLIVCLGAICGVWIMRARVNQRTEIAFGKIDGMLVVAQDHVSHVQQRIRDSQITLTELESALKDWSRREAQQRIAARLDVEGKAERVTQALAQADDGLELASSSLVLVQHALEFGNATGASLDTEPVHRLQETVESWRGELAEAATLVTRIRDGLAGTDSEKSLADRLDRVVRLALRVVATLSSVDDRLTAFEQRITEVRSRVEVFKARTHRWILVIAIGSTLLIAWMAAGQATLCWLGLQGWRQRPLFSPQS